MNLTPALLKSIESTFHLKCAPLKRKQTFVLYYKGEPYSERGKIKQFINAGGAKVKLLSLLEEMFRHSEYWHEYKGNVKLRTDYDADWSGAIAVMPSYGLTSRFTSKEFKTNLKKLRDELLETKIFEIK